MLILAGYLLNALRGTLPCLVKWHSEGIKTDEAAVNNTESSSGHKDGPGVWKIAAGFLMVGLAIANLHVSCSGFIPFFSDLEALQKNPAVFVYDENDRCAYPGSRLRNMTRSSSKAPSSEKQAKTIRSGYAAKKKP